MSERLPVHGFVLAGGKSSRMGEDKSLLRFCGRPMVEIAVEKLRGFCSEVGIAGNRDDLAEFAPVVRETWHDVGPAAGIEAGLTTARQPWTMFIPVDVPLVPGEVLQRWAVSVLDMEKVRPIALSHLCVSNEQPAFCMIRSDKVEAFRTALESGERRLASLFHRAEGSDVHWVHDLYDIYGFRRSDGPDAYQLDRWFINVNTPEDLATAEAWALSRLECGGSLI